MTVVTNNFRQVLFNAGEQVVSADFMSMQRQVEMSFEMLFRPMIGAGIHLLGDIGTQFPYSSNLFNSVVPTDACFCPFPNAAMLKPTSSMHCLLTQGPLIQLSASPNTVTGFVGLGALSPIETSTIINMFWSPGTTSFSFSAADSTHPRIDVVEMKLEHEDATLSSRVVATSAAQATLHLATPNVTTVVGSRNDGFHGNNFTLALVADGSGAGTLTSNGSDVVFHFQSAATTVANFETAVAASNLLEVVSSGTGSNVFGVGDALSATHFSGGLDQVLSGTPLVNKDRRIKATFQINQGVPSATPSYPSATDGFCAVGAVYIPAGFSGVFSKSQMRDTRFPIGRLQTYNVRVPNISPIGSTSWTTTAWGTAAITASGSHVGQTLRASCPDVASDGRILAIGMTGSTAFISTSVQILLKSISTSGLGDPASSGVVATLADLTAGFSALESGGRFTLVPHDKMSLFSSLVPSIPSSTAYGDPFWANGTMYGPIDDFLNLFVASVGLTADLSSAVYIVANEAASEIDSVKFYIAHGLG